ncbi:hypothetical protein BigBertha_133 [Bacillus phage BigBertha]|uniref:Uncharacterized protein n=7 Tax=Caudoviricetes TaxID=2731619 RepID=A0A7U3T927_9CAUD|nr:hypothetical protein TROLL_139 [Bacillus phage Troll]YP_008771160.1 hypothetical protein BigBertha_133 [Bacillus phage BigBertha]YP_009055897.1 hypothetical protein LD11_gp132 [Bacillus phage Riley]YP_009206493.1 hypothetical protein AVV02_gp138 [Bacillus phage AvesoBmore]YP_009290013.1 hypothetical protein BI003_gp134 [Bacillus phage Phrodo]AMW61662.1 hypothetical protein JUGLONE_136 [Bacillus phage Juglone]QPY77527.1 hypothetical protein ANTHOS_134 [Bacillus phage Anthos]UGO48946.1 hypo
MSDFWFLVIYMSPIILGWVIWVAAEIYWAITGEFDY